MSYTIIPELPAGGKENGFPVDINNDLLVIEQSNVTRKITPLSFVSNTIPQLLLYTTPTVNWNANQLGITLSDLQQKDARNVTLKDFMTYVNTHLNVIDEVFFVATNGVDSLDYPERGRNEQLPFASIKFAVAQISQLITNDINYQSNPTPYPGYIPDLPVEDFISSKITTPSSFQNNPLFKTSSGNVGKIRKQYTIMVRSGNYVEQNPIYLPPSTSLIGDNLRRTTIRPANPQLDLFWVDSANYIWGFTFRDHKAPSAAVAFPICKQVYYVANPSANPQNPSTQPKAILKQYAPNDYWDLNEVHHTGDDAAIAWVKDSFTNAYRLQLKDTNLLTNIQAVNENVIPDNRPNIFVSPYTQGCTSYAISDRMPDINVGSNRNNPLYPQTWYLDDDPNGSNILGNGTSVAPYAPYFSDPNTPLAIRQLSAVGLPPPNNAGMGMRIDGSLVNGYFRSMVIDSFTQVNQGGKGIHLLNHGYAQFVSTFTVATEQGIVCEAGATCSISTSNSTFGLSGLVAKGMSYSPVLSGKFVIPSTQAYPIASASTANNNTVNVYGYTVGSNLFTINAVTPVPVKYPNDDVSDNNGFTVASQPYATLCFIVGDNKPWPTSYQADGVTPATWSGPGYLLEDEINENISRTYGRYANHGASTAKGDSYTFNINLSANPMHQVKLFFIEQGAPTPSLSGGKSPNSYAYDIYNTYGLSVPTQTEVGALEYNQGLPWDIYLSYNLPLDLTSHDPYDAFDSGGNPLHWMINYDSSISPVQYYDIYGNAITSESAYRQAIIASNKYRNSASTKTTIDFTNAPVKFFARSVAETGSHTFEYMGTGTRMKYAIPAFGGVTQNKNECVSDGFNDIDERGNILGNKPGIVFFTSSNELGNFNVGTDFTIVQSTGTIQGDTFSRSILTLVTPLTIVLE
jgi:hypothetical protein